VNDVRSAETGYKYESCMKVSSVLLLCIFIICDAVLLPIILSVPLFVLLSVPVSVLSVCLGPFVSLLSILLRVLLYVKAFSC